MNAIYDDLIGLNTSTKHPNGTAFTKTTQRKARVSEQIFEKLTQVFNIDRQDIESQANSPLSAGGRRHLLEQKSRVSPLNRS